MAAVRDEFLAPEYAPARDGVYRFITTNTSVEKVGQNVWTGETGFRTLVDRTAKILAGSRSSFELWRVFLLQEPASVADRGELATFATLQENISIGAHVAVASTAAFPALPLDYSDFHCVPNRLAFINVVPTYLAARFDHANEADRPVVSCYSDIAETLVEKARANTVECFQWTGGTLHELEQRLRTMQRRARLISGRNTKIVFCARGAASAQIFAGVRRG